MALAAAAAAAVATPAVLGADCRLGSPTCCQKMASWATGADWDPPQQERLHGCQRQEILSWQQQQACGIDISQPQAGSA